MYLILTASKDAYITNKIINSNFRVTDANTGRAGTIDLFKLYDETKIEGEESPIVELSRALVKFDLSPLYSLTGSHMSLNNFKCFLCLSSIDTGHFTPTDFDLEVNPLSQDWDEGIGRDVSTFADLDVANFITASFSSPDVFLWFEPGAAARGALGDAEIDIIEEGDLGEGNESITASQHFDTGREDLYVDVTKIISATLLEVLPDYGLRIAFSEAEEQDQKTRFVKRFFSRHSNNKLKQPTLRVLFDDSSSDDHGSFYFNTTGSLFLSNTIRGGSTNILSGSELDVVEGDDCLKFKIMTGSHFEMLFSASSYRRSSELDALPGIYRTEFCLPYTDSRLVVSGAQELSIYDIASASGSITFDTQWLSNDQTVVFATGTLKISRPKTSNFNAISQSPSIKIVNLKTKYFSSETARIRLFGRNIDEKIHPPVKLPVYAKSVFFEEVYYSIRDSLTNEAVIPFDALYKSTRVSRDAEGFYFDLILSSLPEGRNYYFDFMVENDGRVLVESHKALSFRVDR